VSLAVTKDVVLDACMVLFDYGSLAVLNIIVRSYCKDLPTLFCE
jgi:hypothetical protein